jgi:hypothetical protein
MLDRKIKLLGAISSVIFSIIGCGVSEEDRLVKDCKEVESNLIFYAKNNKQDNSELNALRYLQGYKLAASRVFPLIENSEIKSITQDIANVELSTNENENNLQLLDIITKLNSLAVICKIDLSS